MAINGELTASQMGMLMQDDDEEELLGGPMAKKERDIIESNRVKLTSYIHDITTLFPLLRQEGIFNRDDVEIIEAPVTTTSKVDKCLDVLLRKGPKAIGVFHVALSSQYLHLFNYLSQLFIQAGINLPPNRQVKDEEELEKEKGPLELRHSRSNSTYRNGSRSVTIRKRLEVMSKQCEMMEKEKDGLQKALGDREREIECLLSTKEHVQSSLNNVQSKYQELLYHLAHWRTVLESDEAVKKWTVEREGIQREYDQMEQEYNLQCSELNAARERISLLLQQLERSEQMVSITQENCQKEKDTLKHKIAVQEGEVKRLLEKLDVINTPNGDSRGDLHVNLEIQCEKLQRSLDKANDQISYLKERLEVTQKERTQALDERDEVIQKQYNENLRRKTLERENKELKRQIETVSNQSDSLHSPQTPHKLGYHTIGHRPSADDISGSRAGAVKVESLEVFMPAPEMDVDLGMKLELCVVVKELKDGSLPYLHGVRIGDEICQLNKITLSGERPLEFFNRLLFSATEPVTLTLRRQVQTTETLRSQFNTLPPCFPTSPFASHPVSPGPPPHLHPIQAPSSAISPMSPQLGALTLSRKFPAFQSPPLPPSAGSPVNTTGLETSLESKTITQLIGRASTGTSTSTHSTNKDFSSSSSSDDDIERPGVRKRIPEQKNCRLSAASDQSGIVGSPTERTADAVWKNRITRISTIDSGFEFPFTDDSLVQQEDISGDEKKVLMSGDWNQPGWKQNGGDGVGEGGEEGMEGMEEEGEGQRKLFRGRRPGFSGPRRQRNVKKPHNMSKSLDDLNEMSKSPVKALRRGSRHDERTVSITKEVMSQITLIGGRGYGIFIETESRKLPVETGDKILEIGDRPAQCLTRAEAMELLEFYFSKKETAPITVLYDSKGLSQLPRNAKDNFYVRCTQYYRPAHSILSRNNDIAFEKGDILHITNTLPSGHPGSWQAEKIGSKGEILAAGVVPIVLGQDLSDDSGSVSFPQKFKIGSPKLKQSKAISIGEDHRSTLPSSARAFNSYKPVRIISEDLRPVVILGALQKDIRTHLVSNSSPDDVKFCCTTREEEAKLGKCDQDEIVDRVVMDGRSMITTTSHVKELAKEGFHCVMRIDAEGLHMPGLQGLVPIVLLLHATTTRTINKIRQRLPQDLEFNAQEEIDYVENLLKRYGQYFTGRIDLQSNMSTSDIVKEIRTTVARQQKSLIWENDS